MAFIGRVWQGRAQVDSAIARLLVTHQEDVELRAATALALTFLNMAEDPTLEVYESTAAPVALTTKEELALFYLLKAAEFGRERESGAFFHLGLYFLRQGNCELAAHYFELHLRAAGERPGVEKALALLRGQSCEAEVRKEARSFLGIVEG